MKTTVKALMFVLALMLLMTLAACSSVTPSVTVADIPNDNGDIPPFEYSKYIGIWRGYAIAVSETLVITDVFEDKMVFLFVDVMKADGAPDSTSPVHTMPIIDNQIQLVDEGLTASGAQRRTTTILTFNDDHISLLRIVDDEDFGEEYEFEWLLRRVS